MFTRIFPRAFDNDYRGYRVAIWLFVPLVLIRLLMGVNFIWHPENVAVTADAIPLASYSRAAAAAVVSLYAQIGLYRLLLALLTALALLRYRGMIPLLCWPSCWAAACWMVFIPSPNPGSRRRWPDRRLSSPCWGWRPAGSFFRCCPLTARPGRTDASRARSETGAA